MIHGGLNINLKSQEFLIEPCCLRYSLQPSDINNVWNSINFKNLRDLNLSNTWDKQCQNCESLESAGLTSMRTGMNDGLQIYGQTDLSGPARIDLMFDISCNLACRTCGPDVSTFWQKHLKEHNAWPDKIFTPKSKHDVIDILKTLDLSNLRMIVFCGGETLLGQEYWGVAEWLADNVPNAKQNLTIGFQTNGTQPILEKNFATIEKLHLVKLHISLDGTKERFEYLRWPATWNQVTENILKIKETAPSNTMFLVAETISIFNLFYLDELKQWIAHNFSTNKEGDIIDHGHHLASGVYSIDNLSAEYVEHIKQGPYKNLIPSNWVEKPANIQRMLAEIARFDSYRNESFEKTFPEVADLYAKFK